MSLLHASRLAVLCFLLPAAAALTGAAPSAVAAQPARATPSQGISQVSARVAAILDQAEETNDCGPALLDLTLLFDTLIAHAPTRDLAAWREVAAARRMVSHLAALPPSTRRDLFPFLRRSPTLATTLAFLVRSDEDPAPVYRLLDRLRRERGDHLERYATLTAAICVVHDTPLSHTINENTANADDPVAIFDFFRSTERNLLLGLREVPAELLIYVVDTTAPIDQMAWAQGKYKGDRQVGQRFFDVKYDIDHFRRETPKKVTVAGFSFRNILEHGGVCADQAYFAAHVGKSIGVPTAYVRGRDGTVSHAWVGYLQAKGRAVAWNFDTGRYDRYQVVRGMLMDPQSGAWIPDSYLGVLAESMTTPAADRHGAAALIDAAKRLGEIRAADAPFPPATPDPAVAVSQMPRAASAAAQVELIEAALNKTPGSTAGWFALRDLAAAGDLSLSELKRWSEVLFRLCGRSYPEFSLEILSPMIASVASTRDQDALWRSAFKTYSARPDLAAEIRFAQGRMWEAAGDRARAWDCYQDVVTRFPNASSAAVQAVNNCRRMLADAGKDAAALPMLESAWKQTKKPTNMGPTFVLQSNWYRLGRMYVRELEKAGRDREAAKIRQQLGMPAR